MIIQEGMSLQRKLEILSDAAKFDVACTSSGVDRKGTQNGIGNSVACGICHAFSADGRCISLLKVLFTNECIFDCKYCINRSSNDVVRTSFTPRELCELTIEFYRRNYIEGLFLSSGIMVSPNHTMELILEALRMLREDYHFNGYIHCKAIPGTDPALIEALGWYTDRMSINLEFPTAESLKNLAPHKNRKNILKPMRQVQLLRESNHEYLGIRDEGLLPYDGGHRDGGGLILGGGRTDTGDLIHVKGSHMDGGMLSGDSGHMGSSLIIDDGGRTGSGDIILNDGVRTGRKGLVPGDGGHTCQDLASPVEYKGGISLYKKPPIKRSRFVPAGQSTQLIIGATNESDYQIMSVSQALYDSFNLKRVFYSAFVNVNNDSTLPSTQDGPALLREHRLYQADFLLRFYGFRVSELLTEKSPNFNVFLDPKCDWAVRHLELFPVEVNKADYRTLLRVPGIGVNSARRIIAARKSAVLDFKDLKALGVVLKRAVYFITCGGRMMYPVKFNEDFITRELLASSGGTPSFIDKDITYRQLSLFDDVNFKPDEKFIIQRHSPV